jgi:hypothetical protein
MRYPRALLRVAQKFFLTAWMLPLAFLGIALLIVRKRYRVVAILLTVPLYYMCVQSVLHTEYRYVLAIHYFLYIAVAVAICWLSALLWNALRRFSQQRNPLKEDQNNW